MGTLLDPYYYQAAFIIAQNGILRQYRASFLGIAWMVLVPLTQVAVFAFIMPVISGRPHDLAYVTFLVSTFPLWAFIAGALSGSTMSLLTQADAIKRCMVSTTVFPVADVLRHFYSFAISFAVMTAACAVLSGRFTPWVLLTPLYLVPVLVSVCSLAVALSFISPYVRDTPDCLHVVMSVMFWLTPVVYPIEAVAPSQQHWFYWNPFYLLMRPVCLLTYSGVLPGVADTARLLLVTAASAALGYAVHRFARRDFVYYL
jgi:ABC-type polysaccharide/polyol phosphate export permease